MAAPNFKKSQGNSSSTTLSSGVSNSDTSAPLTSDTNFDGEGMVVLSEGENVEEFAYATAKAGGALTIPLANRGLEGGSAQTHTSGATVKGILTAGMWNDLIDTLLIEHDDDGGHNDITADSITLASGATPTAILDEDDMATDSATALATQQSIKAYVDSKTRTRSIWLDAGSFYSALTLAMTDDIGSYLQYPDSAVNTSGIGFVVPQDYASGGFDVYIYWWAASATSGDVVWSIRSSDFVTEGDSRAAAFNQDITDTVGASVQDLVITGPVTLSNTNTIDAGDLKNLGVKRKGTDGSDTMSDTARMMGIRIDYTAY